MSFEERSAWGTLLGVVLVGCWYFPKAAMIAGSVTATSAALISISVIWIVAMVVILAVYHAVIAVWGGDETDERDRLIDLKAERIASHTLAVCALIIVGWIAKVEFRPAAEPVEPLLIAVAILLALTVAESVKYAAQIIYYRVHA